MLGNLIDVLNKCKHLAAKATNAEDNNVYNLKTNYYRQMLLIPQLHQN